MTKAELLLQRIFENTEMYHQPDDDGEYDFSQTGWTACAAMDFYEYKTTAEGIEIIDMLLTGMISYDDATSMASEIDETPEEAKTGELVYQLQYHRGRYPDLGRIFRLEDGSYFVWRSSLKPQNCAERRISAEEYKTWDDYMQDTYEDQSRYSYGSMRDFDDLVEGEFL